MEEVERCLLVAFENKTLPAGKNAGGKNVEPPPDVGTVEAYVRMAEEAEINLEMQQQLLKAREEAEAAGVEGGEAVLSGRW